MDELDKMGGTNSRYSENMTGILTHITDQTQNADFRDRYFSDIDINLSKVFFIFSFNHEEEVNKILRDRMYIIRLKGFSKTEKIQIARRYFIQEMEEIFRLKDNLVWRNETLEWLIDNYCSEEEGVRNLKRKVESVYRTINMLRYFDASSFNSNKSCNCVNDKHIECDQSTQLIMRWNNIIRLPISFPLTLTTKMIQEMIEWQDDEDKRDRTNIMRNMFL
jgi:ATP-dependent Lon protease